MTMSDYTKYTKQEMQAYAIAKNIKENQIVIVGTGLPLIGASLAKRAVCPSCHPIVESGLMDCSPVEVPRSVGDNRFMAHCAVQWPNIRFIGFEANEWLHDEDRLVAFIGGAQIDPYGNVNSTCIYGKGDYVKPQTRFTGSGGANGIATYCNTIIMMQHQKRRFMEKIDYITSCGWMDGPGGREKVGLPGNRGPQMVVTDLGIMKFDEETKRMYLPRDGPGEHRLRGGRVPRGADGGSRPRDHQADPRGDRSRSGLHQGPQGLIQDLMTPRCGGPSRRTC